MLIWLSNNIGTLAAAMIVIAIVCMAAVITIKNKKKGQSSCGCNCAHCAMAGSCHKIDNSLYTGRSDDRIPCITITHKIAR